MIWVPFWWSRGIGGRSAVDYLMRVRDMTFIEAVSQIANNESALRKQYQVFKPLQRRQLHRRLQTRSKIHLPHKYAVPEKG